MNGYDKYLEFQFGWSGDFYKLLFMLISKADEGNLYHLSLGFPDEVEAYKTWSRIGKDAFLAKCSPSHPLIKGIEEGELIL